MKRKISAIILLVIMALALTACSQSDQSGVDYSDAENWAYLQTEEEGRADVFLSLLRYTAAAKTASICR